MKWLFSSFIGIIFLILQHVIFLVSFLNLKNPHQQEKVGYKDSMILCQLYFFHHQVMMKFTSHHTAIDMVLSSYPPENKYIDWSAYVRCECKHGTRPPSLNNTRKFFMIFTFKITRIHSNLWCYGQLTVFSPAGQWRRFWRKKKLIRTRDVSDM